MASLPRELRKDLANKVISARRIAEEGARKVVESLAVHSNAPWESMSPAEKKLRNRLRAHGRQLGDERDQKGVQSISRLVSEVAYEHWHGMLFARFLAENDLLLMPDTATAITLEEVEEIAREEKRNWLAVVSEYAEKMLPQIFRTGDPALEVVLPRETQNDLEKIVRGLDAEVFTASDSLGWVYQFWQADRKDEVNASGDKVGADELAAVTQLFTEDYMVDFLLDNTLGAWHAGKILSANPLLAETAKSEDELRNAVALPGCPWTYLRFVQKDGRWTPAAGTFDSWPRTVDKLRCLDPCMGSGHFVVAMFERLTALRVAELGMGGTEAVSAVISENLFGLEIDPRCTQIAAFNLALAAWRKIGHCVLPPMNLACSGLAPNVRREDWLKLAGNNDRLQSGMKRLYALFKDAPILGSLIDPFVGGGDLLEAEFHELQPLLEKALGDEIKDDATREAVVAASGLAKAAELLARKFTLIATNVPYLGRGKQDIALMDYCERVHPEAKADLATCFVERCLESCAIGGTVTLVTPQNWLFLTSYRKFRSALLKTFEWNQIARLGDHAFESIAGGVVRVVLLTITRSKPQNEGEFAGLEASNGGTPELKAIDLREALPVSIPQLRQLDNPDSRITFDLSSNQSLLSEYAQSLHGQGSFDSPCYVFSFWETPSIQDGWVPQQTSPTGLLPYSGCSVMIRWENGQGMLARLMSDKASEGYTTGKWRAGVQIWNQKGVVVSLMRRIVSSIYCGASFDDNVAVISPFSEDNLLPIYAFCESGELETAVRGIDQKLNVPCNTLAKVPFDLAHWQKVAAEKYPNGLPNPKSNDATQWIFNGHPKNSDQPLQVAVARLLGYRWPRQTGLTLPDCPGLEADDLDGFADADGIVCLSSPRGEPSGEERLRELLNGAWGKEWNAAVLEDLLSGVGYAGKRLDDWLRDGFFEQHCATFQSRPFIWHVWTARRLQCVSELSSLGCFQR